MDLVFKSEKKKAASKPPEEKAASEQPERNQKKLSRTDKMTSLFEIADAKETSEEKLASSSINRAGTTQDQPNTRGGGRGQSGNSHGGQAPLGRGQGHGTGPNNSNAPGGGAGRGGQGSLPRGRGYGRSGMQQQQQRDAAWECKKEFITLLAEVWHMSEQVVLDHASLDYEQLKSNIDNVNRLAAEFREAAEAEQAERQLHAEMAAREAASRDGEE